MEKSTAEILLAISQVSSLERRTTLVFEWIKTGIMSKSSFVAVLAGGYLEGTNIL
jgi:hypothetical protein